MREIKFRAWDLGRMIPVGSIDLFTDGEFLIDDEIPVPCDGLMQFTGLKDKNGKEIYEGDIIQDDGGYLGGIKYKGVVKFGETEKGRGRFWSDTSIFGTPDALSISGFAEVIGNIHENPELLNPVPSEREEQGK